LNRQAIFKSKRAKIIGAEDRLTCGRGLRGKRIMAPVKAGDAHAAMATSLRCICEY
jgi:hypothetical protein